MAPSGDEELIKGGPANHTAGVFGDEDGYGFTRFLFEDCLNICAGDWAGD